MLLELVVTVAVRSRRKARWDMSGVVVATLSCLLCGIGEEMEAEIDGEIG